MAKTPNFKELNSVLKKLNFYVVRQKGSHIQFSNNEVLITVAKHSNKEISIGVYLDILRTLNLSKQEFWNMLKK